MTDYLARAMEAGDLPGVLRKLDRFSTAFRRPVEKTGASEAPGMAEMGRDGGVFHALRPPVERTVRFNGPGALSAGELRPFPPRSAFDQQAGTPEAEAVDRAFQRDSRRYDGGFFLY